MRLVGYIRVSKVGGRSGDSFISPKLQREQIEALAKLRSWTIIEWIEDLDESGGKWERPGFQRALQMVERGEADGIAVAKLDRFARSVIDALRAIERIRDAGGELVSVTDNFDTTTAIGKAMLQITLVFAELERERQREGFRLAAARAINRGIHISAVVPIGYRRGKDRRLVKDARAARRVREAFIRRGNGESIGAIAAYLDRRLPLDGGRTWTTSRVDKMLRSRTYLGEAHQGDIVNPAAHDPVVTRAEWEAAQPTPGQPRKPRSKTLLSGLLRCGSCGGAVTRVSSTDYGCRARRSNGICDTPVTIRLAVADEFVSTAFLEWASENALNIQASERDDVVDGALERLDAAEGEYVAYRDSALLTVIGEDDFRGGLEARAVEVDMAREALVRAQTERVVPFAHYDAPSLWPELDNAERRLLIESAIDHVVVKAAGSTSGGSLPARDRLRVRWHDLESPLREARA